MSSGRISVTDFSATCGFWNIFPKRSLNSRMMFDRRSSFSSGFAPPAPTGTGSTLPSLSSSAIFSEARRSAR